MIEVCWIPSWFAKFGIDREQHSLSWERGLRDEDVLIGDIDFLFLLIILETKLDILFNVFLKANILQHKHSPC